jgi:hypothetical protein
MVNNVVVAAAVEDAIANKVSFVSPLFACIENLAHGEVVPIPILPLPDTLNFSVREVPPFAVVSKEIYVPFAEGVQVSPALIYTPPFEVDVKADPL